MISRVNSEVESGWPLCMKRARSLVAFPSAKLASSAYDKIGGFLPAYIFKHHNGRKYQ